MDALVLEINLLRESIEGLRSELAAEREEKRNRKPCELKNALSGEAIREYFGCSEPDSSLISEDFFQDNQEDFLRRFGPPFIFKERDGAAIIRKHEALSLRGPNKKVVALVHVKRLKGPYFEVTEVRPVLDREQERPALESYRQSLMQERS